MDQKNISTTEFPLRLGTSIVKLHILSTRYPKINLINLHSDETTSIKVGKAFLQNHQGTFSYLSHNPTRNIIFHLNHQEVSFDPNRMFSKSGITGTLEETNSFSKEALKINLGFPFFLIIGFLVLLKKLKKESIIGKLNGPINMSLLRLMI